MSLTSANIDYNLPYFTLLAIPILVYVLCFTYLNSVLQSILANSTIINACVYSLRIHMSAHNLVLHARVM